MRVAAGSGAFCSGVFLCVEQLPCQRFADGLRCAARAVVLDVVAVLLNAGWFTEEIFVQPGERAQRDGKFVLNAGFAFGCRGGDQEVRRGDLRAGHSGGRHHDDDE